MRWYVPTGTKPTERWSVTLPNPASEALHRSVGFVPVGTYHRIGWEAGAWHDVAWYELHLPGEDPPAEPRFT